VYSTVLGALSALAAGQLVEHWQGDRMHAYSLAFAMAGIAGFIGLRYLAAIPEPVMDRRGPPLPIRAMLTEPLHDGNFRRLIVFMASWNFASNLATPFLTVYLLQQMEFGLGTVTSLWAVSQVANALTLFSWGRISDRLTNKAILAVALPAYFGCVIAFTVIALPEPHGLTLPLLFLIHIVMGTATGGIGLATGNIGLKLAPQGRGTPYLATMSLVASLAAGVAAILGGSLAQWFAWRELSILVNWSSPSGAAAWKVLQFQHWEFLFAISFALGLYVMHALSRVREGEEHSERIVVQQFVFEAGRVFEQMSSIAVVSLTAVFPFGRLIERRRRPRAPQPRMADAA
jgi:MFS family permease